MAFATMLLRAIAWKSGTPAVANRIAFVFGLHVDFAALFAGSAWLFRYVSTNR